MCVDIDLLNHPNSTGDLQNDTVDSEDGSGPMKKTFVGTGEPHVCSTMLHRLVYKAIEPWHCHPKPCAIGTYYQPTIQPTQKFYALGAFNGMVKTLGVMLPNGSFSPARTYETAVNFCSTVSVDKMQLWFRLRA